MKKAILILMLLAVLAGNVSALDAERKVMDNGLIVLHSQRTNLPMVVVNLLIKASPLDVDAKKAGLADLTAGMLSEGTGRRTAEQISEEVEFIGAAIGADADDDYTTISMSVLKKDIDKGFDVFTDVLLNPVFPSKELENMQGRIVGSIRQSEEDPQYIAGVEFGKAVFGEHPYGRPVSGSVESVTVISRSDLVGFHRKYYAPNNSILSVVGDISSDELMDIMKKYFSGWTRRDIPMRPTYEVSVIDSPKIIKIDRELTQANIVLGHIGIERKDPDYHAVSVMNFILGGGGFSSRLMQRVRDELGLAYDVHSFFMSAKQKGYFQAGVQTKNEAANKVIREILVQIERMISEDVSKEELDGAKAYLTGSFPRRLDTMSKLSGLLAQVEFYGLGMSYEKDYIAGINKVTIEDVRRVANKYLYPDRYVLVVVADQDKAGIKDSP
ncbi:MAG: insulinase family protein [Nitrospirota bacterium]|nr:MAG: insulinase family protein [Nitrospirota bacterium]